MQAGNLLNPIEFKFGIMSCKRKDLSSFKPSMSFADGGAASDQLRKFLFCMLYEAPYLFP